MLFYQILIFLLILISFFILFVLIKVNTKRARIRRYFRHSTGIRQDLVMNISENAVDIPQDLTPQEMVSILTLISAKTSVIQAYHAANHFAKMSGHGNYDSEFYKQLENLARTFSTRQWMLESLELLRLGQMIANKYGETYWSEEYRSYINSITYLLKKRRSTLNLS
jgi:hypothetical protein